MKRAHLFLTLVAALSAVQANALSRTSGPFRDFLGLVTPSNRQISYGTLFGRPLIGYSLSVGGGQPYGIANPVTGCVPSSASPNCIVFFFHDRFIGIGPDPDARVAGLAFMTTDDAMPDAPIRFTTLYGLDSGDGGTHIVGFDPAHPFVISDERFIDTNGVSRFADTEQTLRIGDAAAFLGPDFDLSALSGDPDRLIYTLDTYIPADQLSSFGTVPEPGTWASMAFGLALAGIAVRRSKWVAMTA